MLPSFTAGSLAEALTLRQNPRLIPYTGGTDLMIEAKEDAQYLFLHKVPEMKRITADGEYIRFGASCTFNEIIGHHLTPAILKEACLQIAAPAIRNAGSIGGNLGNGSAKADSALIFTVTDAQVRLASAGGERLLPVRDFYAGNKRLALAPDELITEVLLPKDGLDNYYYKKVGARGALAIARVSFAGIMAIKDGVIKNCAVSFGAVSEVILCFAEIDQMLIGKTLPEAGKLKEEYLQAYNRAIIPNRGRVSGEYRKDVCLNLLRDFLESNGV